MQFDNIPPISVNCYLQCSFFLNFFFHHIYGAQVVVTVCLGAGFWVFRGKCLSWRVEIRWLVGIYGIQAKLWDMEE